MNNTLCFGMTAYIHPIRKTLKGDQSELHRARRALTIFYNEKPYGLRHQLFTYEIVNLSDKPGCFALAVTHKTQPNHRSEKLLLQKWIKAFNLLAPEYRL
jgi:hypothetical protein